MTGRSPGLGGEHQPNCDPVRVSERLRKRYSARVQGVRNEMPGHATDRPFISIDKDALPYDVQTGDRITRKKTGAVYQPAEPRRDDMQRIASVPPDKWFELSAWAKQTGNLQPWQRGLAFSIGRLLGRGKELSRKQATQGVKILDEAVRLGFKALP